MTRPATPAGADFVAGPLTEPFEAAAVLSGVPEGEAAGRRAVHGAGATLIAQGIKFVLRFGSAIALGRLLSPAEFGIVAMVAPVLAFVATLNDLGFAQAIVQRRDVTTDQISGLFWVNVGVSMVLAAMLMACAPLVAWLYREPRTIGITLAMAAGIVIGTIGLVPNAILSRQMRFVVGAAIEIGTLVVSVAVSVALAARGWGYWSLVIGQLASSAAGVIGVFGVTRWHPQWLRRRPQVGALVRFGANLTGVNLATYFSMMADRIIIGAVNGKTALGLYERSYTLALQPLTQLMAPLGRVAVPLLSRIGDDRVRMRDTFLLMLQLGVLMTVPAMLVCILLGGSAITFLLGPKWAAAGPVFAWVCFGGLAASLFSGAGWLFTAEDRTREQLRLSVWTAIISVASFALGSIWGAVGVAAVSALSFAFLQTPLMLFGLTRRGCLSGSDLGRALWPSAIAAAAAAIAVAAIAHSIPAPASLFVAGAAAYAVFAGMLMLLPGGTALRVRLLRLSRTLRRSDA